MYHLQKLLIFTCIILSFTTEVAAFGKRYLKRLISKEMEGDISKNSSAPQWMTQKLNHFNFADRRVWKQRYFVNDTFYKRGGPIFLKLGGEGESKPSTMQATSLMTWAREFSALCILLEHRYYGESRPTEDLSVENLEYLSSDQALADAAMFRKWYSEKFDVGSGKWIVFGNSYAGSLAAWMRLKYPHLIDAAVASSAPVLAKVNFSEYMEVVRDALYEVSPSCITAISNAMTQIEDVAKSKDSWTKITKDFRLCSEFDGNNSDDYQNFFSLLSSFISSVVQYNNAPLRGNKTANHNLKWVCDTMDNTSVGDEASRFAEIVSTLLDDSDGEDMCLEHRLSEYNRDAMNVSLGMPSNNDRQWLYQVCTEFGYIQNTDHANHLFGQGVSLSFLVKQCADVFGPNFTLSMLDCGVNETNLNYGGLELQVTNVMFVNGGNDPWHRLSILRDLNRDVKAIVIPGDSHSADTYPESPDDLPQRVEAREAIKNQIRMWLYGA